MALEAVVDAPQQVPIKDLSKLTLFFLLIGSGRLSFILNNVTLAVRLAIILASNESNVFFVLISIII